MTYTPGPWSTSNCGVVLEDRDGDRESRVVCRCEGRPERTANAALIAAAPELLESLEHLIYLFGDTGGWKYWGPAIKAVKKARG